MADSIVTKDNLIEAFRRLGLRPGDAVMVHVSLSSLGFVVGGPQSVIEALVETVGKNGTIMMPAQSWKNLDPDTGVHGDIPDEWKERIRELWPPYDPAITPTNTMGAVAEMFRRWPGAKRSGHPARSVAAWGANADFLTKDHDLSNIFGAGSPLDRLYDLDGRVLLIGVGYDKNTSLHLADAHAEYPEKRLVTEHSAVMENGKRVWKAYDTLYVDGEDFTQIGEAFEKAHAVTRETVGAAELRLMSQRQLVDFAVQWIEDNRI